MKSNGLLIALVVLLGVLCGIAMINGVGNSVQLGLTPISYRLNSIEASQKLVVQKLDAVGRGGDVSTRLAAIEAEVKSIKDILNGSGPAAPMPQPPQEDPNKVYTIDIAHSPILGKKDAPITIVEFSDFQCPFCTRFYPPLKEVLKAYPDKVRVVIKNFPLSFHPNAKPSAKLAFAAHEQGKYYDMVDLILENGADVSEAKVKDYAKQLKLNYNKLIKDLKDNDATYEKYITDDMNLGTQVQVQGTPTFFLNGKKTNARDFNAYKAEIDQILAGQ